MVFDPVDHVTDDDLGFDEVVICAEFFGAGFVFGLAERRQHDDADIHGLWRIAQDVEDIKAVDLGHHGVEQDKIGLELDCVTECELTIGNMLDSETL